MAESKKKKATIKDVAGVAHVSIATASRVLSGSGYPVKAELKSAILAAAQKLDYRPNVFGQLLRGGTNKQIGVVVPSISNPFYNQLFAAVQKACIDQGYMPILYSSHSDRSMEQYYIDMLIHYRVAGALLSLMGWEAGMRTRLEEAGIPCVLFDQPHEDPEVSSIDFDFYSGGKLAAEYLIGAGHQEIVFATGAVDRPSRKRLLAGFQAGLELGGCSFGEEQLVVHCVGKGTGASAMKDYQCGQELGEKILERPYIPDAVFAVNDMMAIGIIKKLETSGIHVPVDISVLGFDNVEFGEMIVPALTTISQSAYRTGELAAEILFESVAGGSRIKKKLMLEPVLVERDSVRRKHNKIRRNQ